MNAAPTKADANPDVWPPGLRLRLKTLSVKTVTRATEPGEVLPVCLSHNLRAGNEDHRHRSRIDPARTGANEVLRGPACPLVAGELARSILDELGAIPSRRDTIMGIEAVIQAPDGSDTPTFWTECLTWATGRYQHVLSAVVHRDQARPHMHVIALAVADNKLAGNALTSGERRFTRQRQEFLARIRTRLGLRPDRPALNPLTTLALSTGKGPKTAAACARRDAALARTTGAEWRREAVGMGVDGHGGLSTKAGNPHAHEKEQPPLLRSFSPATQVSNHQPNITHFVPERIRSLWAQVAAFGPTPAAPMTPCPRPGQRAGQGAQA